MTGWATLLVAIRLFAILRAQALWSSACGVWWQLIAAALAIGVTPVVSVASIPAPQTAAQAVTMIVMEALLGTVLGLLVSLPGWALVGANEASSAELGLSEGAQFVKLGCCFVAAAALSVDLHRPLLTALVGLTERWPVGRPEQWLEAPTAGGVAGAAHESLVLALALATPVLLAVAGADLCMRIVGGGPRPGRQLAEALRPWARLALGLGALGASWAAYEHAWLGAVFSRAG